jgi:hypothetical protein
MTMILEAPISIEEVAFTEVVTFASVKQTARCADGNGTLTPLFFSDENIDIARAKAICARCSLSTSCLEGALERDEPWGVWGGELIENGRIVVDRRPRGRPSMKIAQFAVSRALVNRRVTRWPFESPSHITQSSTFISVMGNA